MIGGSSSSGLEPPWVKEGVMGRRGDRRLTGRPRVPEACGRDSANAVCLLVSVQLSLQASLRCPCMHVPITLECSSSLKLSSHH